MYVRAVETVCVCESHLAQGFRIQGLIRHILNYTEYNQ